MTLMRTMAAQTNGWSSSIVFCGAYVSAEGQDAESCQPNFVCRQVVSISDEVAREAALLVRFIDIDPTDVDTFDHPQATPIPSANKMATKDVALQDSWDIWFSTKKFETENSKLHAPHDVAQASRPVLADKTAWRIN